MDLAGTALLLAALDRPGLPLERYRDHVGLLQLDTARIGATASAARSLESRIGTMLMIAPREASLWHEAATFLQQLKSRIN